ncbi:nucleoside diphosphate kinase [Trypanosoma rangeli]|uniref:Nucleoside diphosphate kinase n=1 Tax=Trypanosoma rangeli TaxID=5698 RepID=A0A3R7M6K1_TRYRA|nr:nucleoside diphosphate kinase [Trypanosoma rangeli]RNF00381.1 nucleoside diphosphate kinase [Trypanosoma rangeli]|eukprot:RNF00381.1 nucleoside diphosphate kinase [Trypanosoma rangeli]
MALSKQDPRLAFYCERHDDISQLVRRYILFFFYEDHSVEMRELPKNVIHLRRTPFPHLRKDCFRLGTALTIFGGIVKITGYADEVTRVLCEKESESTVMLLGESLLPQLGHYLAMLTEECGFAISSMQMVWPRGDIFETYGLPEGLTNGRVVVACCVRADAVQKGLDYMNRATGAFAARDEEEAKKWAQLVEEVSRKPVAIFEDPHCSVVIVKPHAVRSRNAGSILQLLLDAGLEPAALRTANLSSRVVDIFLQPYKDVLPDFSESAKGLTGHVWVIQLVSPEDEVDVVSLVREVCGPFDPIIAKELRPKSVRAIYGADRANNAVHCCDLPEEGAIYTNFFFGSKYI